MPDTEKLGRDGQSGSGAPRPVVLVLLGCFSTGVEATGPNQNLLGMVRALSHRYRFRVLAEAVPGDTVGEWQVLQGVEQMPLESIKGFVPGLRAAIAATPHDAILSNGFFDRGFTIPSLLLRKLRLIPRRPYLLATHGEFSPGALAISARLKAAYLAVVRRFGLLDDVTLQSTTELETSEIRAGFPSFDGPIAMTPVIRSIPSMPDRTAAPGEGPLRVVFLSRIDRKKNLHYALECLARAGIEATYDIYGPVSDEAYWRECQAVIRAMPPNVTVTHRGVVTQREVPHVLSRYDLFFMPTLGENFGHAIVDALAVGLPVLISDQTSWRGLETAHAGWDIPLDDRDATIAALRWLDAAGPDERLRLSAGAHRYITDKLADDDAVHATQSCLDQLIGPRDAASAS